MPSVGQLTIPHHTGVEALMVQVHIVNGVCVGVAMSSTLQVSISTDLNAFDILSNLKIIGLNRCRGQSHLYLLSLTGIDPQ